MLTLVDILFIFIVYLCVFLENFWLLILMFVLFAAGVIFALLLIRKKGVSGKIIGISIGVLVGIVFPMVLLMTVLQSDFVKSRKNVDKDWLMGKTLEQIEARYSCPEYYKSKKITNPDYHFACREIYDWEWFDGCESDYQYIVSLDDSGRVNNIVVYDNNYDFPGAVNDHSHDKYEDRWDIIFTYKLLSFSPSFRGPVNDKNK